MDAYKSKCLPLQCVASIVIMSMHPNCCDKATLVLFIYALPPTSVSPPPLWAHHQPYIPLATRPDGGPVWSCVQNHHFLGKDWVATQTLC